MIGVADVPVVHGDPAPRILRRHAGHELLRALLAAPVAGRNFGALIGRLAADGGADASRAAGDQRHPVADRAQSGLRLPGLVRLRLSSSSSHRVLPISCVPVRLLSARRTCVP
jgi:hypothetical protein